MLQLAASLLRFSPIPGRVSTALLRNNNWREHSQAVRARSVPAFALRTAALRLPLSPFFQGRHKAQDLPVSSRQLRRAASLPLHFCPRRTTPRQALTAFLRSPDARVIPLQKLPQPARPPGAKAVLCPTQN